jgi:hypothetical protein
VSGLVLVPAEDGACPDAMPSVRSGAERSFAAAMWSDAAGGARDAAMTYRRQMIGAGLTLGFREPCDPRRVPCDLRGVRQARTRSDRLCADPAPEKHANARLMHAGVDVDRSIREPCWKSHVTRRFCVLWRQQSDDLGQSRSILAPEASTSAFVTLDVSCQDQQRQSKSHSDRGLHTGKHRSSSYMPNRRGRSRH